MKAVRLAPALVTGCTAINPSCIVNCRSIVIEAGKPAPTVLVTPSAAAPKESAQ